MIDILNQRFSAPKPEYYRRRILVWMDEDGEFADSVAEHVPQSVRLLVMREDNMFLLRRQIELDYAEEDILLYCPLRFQKPQDNWLLDVFLYSEEFRADYWSLLFEELGIQNTRQLRDYAKSIKGFFNSQERRARLRAISPTFASAEALRDAAFNAVLGLKTGDLAGAVRAALSRDLFGEGGAIAAIEKLCGEGAFWGAVKATYGFDARPEPSLLAAHLLCSAATLTLKPETFNGLPFSRQHATVCYAFFNEWFSRDREGLKTFCEAVERQTGMAGRLRKADRDQVIKTAVFPCIDPVLLVSPFQAFAKDEFHPVEAEALLGARREKPWAVVAGHYFDALSEIITMQAVAAAYQSGFHFSKARDLWKAYTAELYRMDQAYRRFHVAYEAALHEGLSLIEDDLKAAAERVENLYKGWFLSDLNAKWSALVRDELKPGWHIDLVPLQRHFYSDNVQESEMAGRRVFVIISDALRYELAQELTGQLNARLGGNSACEAMQGVFPTVTAFGMAATLPHRKLQIDEKLEVLADGQSTAMGNREAVLKAANPDNIAVSYETLMQMNRPQRLELIRGRKAVYIYHNAIDAVGDHAPSERDVFRACATCVTELTSLMRMIVNELSGATVLITADHGFLYTHAPLKEIDKAPKDFVRGEVLEMKRRYAIARGEEESPLLLALKMDDFGRGDLSALTPRECLRFKLPGGGVNYVHGGLSLQEMVIPLIRYQNRKAGQKGFQPAGKAVVALAGESRRISNNIFSLPFLQKEPVSDKTLPRVVTAHFEDDRGNAVSDTNRILADRAGVGSEDRFFRLSFHLTGGNFDRTRRYDLVLRDEEDKVELERVPFTIDIAFGLDLGL